MQVGRRVQAGEQGAEIDGGCWTLADWQLAPVDVLEEQIWQLKLPTLPPAANWPFGIVYGHG